MRFNYLIFFALVLVLLFILTVLAEQPEVKAILNAVDNTELESDINRIN